MMCDKEKTMTDTKPIQRTLLLLAGILTADVLHEPRLSPLVLVIAWLIWLLATFGAIINKWLRR
jgi:hypothetical protein